MTNYRFGLFTLLATSLINAVYQNSNSQVVSIAIALAVLALVLLALTFLPNVKSILSNRILSFVLWTVIAGGVIFNVLS